MTLPYLLSMEGKDEEGIQYVCHHWGEGWATSCWRSHHWSMRLTYETNCAHQHALILVRLVNNSNALEVCFFQHIKNLCMIGTKLIKKKNHKIGYTLFTIPILQ